MRRKSKPIVFLEILVLLFIAALTFTGFGLADECEEPPADGDYPPPRLPMAAVDRSRFSRLMPFALATKGK